MSQKTQQFNLGWNTSTYIKHTCPKNARRVSSLPSECINRVFYSFQCYEKHYSTCWAAKAKCIPTFFAMNVFLGSQLTYFSEVRPVSKFDTNFWWISICQMSATYVRSFALEESLRQTRLFGVKIVDFVLDGMNYVRTHSTDFLSQQIQSKKVKQSVFIQTIQGDSITAFESNMRSVEATYISKDSNTSKEIYKMPRRKYGSTRAV